MGVDVAGMETLRDGTDSMTATTPPAVGKLLLAGGHLLFMCYLSVEQDIKMGS